VFWPTRSVRLATGSAFELGGCGLRRNVQEMQGSYDVGQSLHSSVVD
jgi:hypothetical protein